MNGNGPAEGYFRLDYSQSANTFLAGDNQATALYQAVCDLPCKGKQYLYFLLNLASFQKGFENTHHFAKLYIKSRVCHFIIFLNSHSAN